jgi:NADH:ubiquinone oxidoreductase subunit F (NADH-binding)
MKRYDKCSLIANILAYCNDEMRWKCIAKQWGSTNNPTIMSRMKTYTNECNDLKLIKQIYSDLKFLRHIHAVNMKRKSDFDNAIKTYQNAISGL